MNKGVLYHVSRHFFESAQSYQNQVYLGFFSFYAIPSYIFRDLGLRQAMTTILSQEMTFITSTGQNSVFSLKNLKNANSTKRVPAVNFFGMDQWSIIV